MRIYWYFLRQGIPKPGSRVKDIIDYSFHSVYLYSLAVPQLSIAYCIISANSHIIEQYLPFQFYLLVLSRSHLPEPEVPGAGEDRSTQPQW
jgi:hypothetical protein